jgi:argininosuccinate synthase
MRSIEAFFDDTQQSVNGTVELALTRERFAVQGITSPHDMMVSKVATYGEMNTAFSGDDAKGFATIASITTMLHRSVQS